MSAQIKSGSPQVSDVSLVICDAAGRLLAVSANASQELIPCSPTVHQHFSELFGESSAITAWLTDHLGQARRAGDYYVEHQIENDGGRLTLRLESLMCDQELYGFALTLAPAPSSSIVSLEEGDAVVYRKQWHEIKNYIGALKLYATFLSKKLPDGDEKQTIEKMLAGINGLIEYLARIRRGETQ
jgi:nitrogen-specific signal transduction histidine kinase